MAIAKIKKLELIGLEKDQEAILGLLQKLGLVELIQVRAGKIAPPAETVHTLTSALEIDEAISFLKGFQGKSAFFKDWVKFKPQVYEQELKEVIANFDYQAILKKLLALRNHLKNLNQHKEKLIQERQLLTTWQNLNIPLDEIRNTQKCGILLGILRKADQINLLEDCQKLNLDLFTQSVKEDKANIYLAIFYLQEEFQRLEDILKNHHFNFVTLTRHKCTVKLRLLEINREILIFEDQIEDARGKIIELARQQINLMMVYDYLTNTRRRQEAGESLTRQEFTFILSAWIREKDQKLIEQELLNRFRDTAIFVSEPREDEVVPVILENKRLIEPFEFITSIYGMPRYHELDPTPFLAPFFFLYFGFCVSDVGYGLLLILFSWMILKKFKFGPLGQKGMKLFLYCGISTVIVGALTGGWFGNLLDMAKQDNLVLFVLKRFKDSLILLDPMKEPTKLLGIALSFGIIQVWFGNIVAAIGNIKNRRYWDVLLDQVSMLILLFGLTGLGFIFLKLISPVHTTLFKSTSLIGALALIATQGRSEKGTGAKLFLGIFTLYNALSGYLSDILSYSRLWALGLVTGVMANTINLISAQLPATLISVFAVFLPFLNIPAIKLVSIILLVALTFIFGHFVSFCMNLLGAFIHPVRLQFVEFFSKFFKAGGNPFKPFRVESKYIQIK